MKNLIFFIIICIGVFIAPIIPRENMSVFLYLWGFFIGVIATYVFNHDKFDEK